MGILSVFVVRVTYLGVAMRHLTFVFTILIFLGASFAFAPVAAQSSLTPSTSSNEAEAKITVAQLQTPEAVRGLVSRLSDSEVRALLLDQLDAKAKESNDSGPKGSFLHFAGTAGGMIAKSVYEGVIYSPLLWNAQKKSFKTFHDKLGWAGIGKLFGTLIVAMGIGFLVEKFVNFLFNRRFNALLSQDRPDTLRETLRFLLLRLAIEMLGLVAFFTVTRLIATSVLPPEYQIFGQTLMLYLVVIPRVGAAVLRLIFAPKCPEFRLLSATDEQAQSLFNYQLAIFFVMGLMAAILVFNALNDIPMDLTPLGFWLNLFVNAFFI